jgi:hypothetical protein
MDSQFDFFDEMTHALEAIKKKGNVDDAMKKFDDKMANLIQKVDTMDGIDTNMKYKDELHDQLSRDRQEK